MPFFKLNKIPAVLLFVLTAASALAQTNGIYAVMETSMGSITCRLDYVEAPKTVANFVGLVEGSRGWIDFQSGDVGYSNYFDNTFFHRVVSTFVIQAGLPFGNGITDPGDKSGGPGYTFPDEFSPSLRHNKAGILSMANSGPHSNGSQLFITLSATPWLDDVHSVFGEVAGGMDVVNTIGLTNPATTPVTIHTITILRIGASALAFDAGASAHELPVVGGAETHLSAHTGALELNFSSALFHEYYLFDSTDLSSWEWTRLGINLTPPTDAPINVTAFGDGIRHFFAVPQVTYDGPINVFTPDLLDQGVLFMDNQNPATADFDTIEMTMLSATAHTEVFNGGAPSGPWTHSLLQEAYRGVFNNVGFFRVSLLFTNQTSGTFVGSITSGGGGAINGDFTLTIP